MSSDQFQPIETFQFMENFVDETNNGLYLNNIYLPEEIIQMILSYIDPKEILRASEVCKKWCNIIKSDSFWSHIYHRHFHKKPKKLPWFVYYCFFVTNYFDRNLIQNGNGQNGFKHWKIVLNYGDQFRIEDPPSGADPLPSDIDDFNGKSSCFATSYYECNKYQEIEIPNRLLRLILDRYKPAIYVSEWIAARFDCGCVYNLWCKLIGDVHDEIESEIFVEHLTHRFSQWENSTWIKKELLIKNYPAGVKKIIFQHEGRDTQFWKGHYGSKMAGAVVKLLFESIE